MEDEARKRDELALALCGHRAEIVEADEWRPLAAHVLALVEEVRAATLQLATAALEESERSREAAERRVKTLEADREHWAQLTGVATQRRIDAEQRVADLAQRASISFPEARALLDGMRRATTAKELWSYERGHDALHLLMDWLDQWADRLRAKGE